MMTNPYEPPTDEPTEPRKATRPYHTRRMRGVVLGALVFVLALWAVRVWWSTG